MSNKKSIKVKGAINVDKSDLQEIRAGGKCNYSGPEGDFTCDKHIIHVGFEHIHGDELHIHY